MAARSRRLSPVAAARVATARAPKVARRGRRELLDGDAFVWFQLAIGELESGPAEMEPDPVAVLATDVESGASTLPLRSPRPQGRRRIPQDVPRYSVPRAGWYAVLPPGRFDCDPSPYNDIKPAEMKAELEEDRRELAADASMARVVFARCSAYDRSLHIAEPLEEPLAQYSRVFALHYPTPRQAPQLTFGRALWPIEVIREVVRRGTGILPSRATAFRWAARLWPARRY